MSVALTDVCSGVDLPEVEIVSLLAEELPRYTLRADHVFGYEHDDWLHTPLLPPEAALGLTYEQIEETFKYFRKSALSHSVGHKLNVACHLSVRISFASKIFYLLTYSFTPQLNTLYFLTVLTS